MVSGSDVLHGLLLYSSKENYLTLARTNSKIVVTGSLDSTDTGILAKGLIQRYLRIRKYTRDQSYSTYCFYTSSEGYNSFSCIYTYVDTKHYFDDAFYGILASGTTDGSAKYDAFSENIPSSDIDTFQNKEIDGIWISNNFAKVSANGSLKVNSAETGTKPWLLRPQRQGNWMIDTKVSKLQGQERTFGGLMLYKDAYHYIVIGINGDGKIESRIVNGNYLDEKTINNCNQRLMIQKKDSQYTLLSSEDAFTWNTIMCFDDENLVFENALYGFGGHIEVGGNTRATLAFFRERPLPNGRIQGVSSLREIGAMIGTDQALNNTAEIGILGADLGHFLDLGDRYLVMFGDTFAGVNKTGRSWSNSLFSSNDNDPQDGLTLDYVFAPSSGTVAEKITSKHINNSEITCIPNCGIELDGTIYYHYMSVHHWGDAGHWDINGTGFAMSFDGGASFIKQPLLFTGDTHFGITYMVKGKDDYIYLFGTTASKLDAIYLSRFRAENILDKEKYEFWAGRDNAGNGIWSANELEACRIIYGSTGEFSVNYSTTLNRYLLINQNVHTFDIVVREAKTPTGPWSEPVTLVDHTLDFYNSYNYSPNTLNRFILRDGKTMYFLMTRWVPYVPYWEEASLILE